MRRFLLALLCLLPLALFAADSANVKVDLSDFTSRSVANRRAMVTPLSFTAPTGKIPSYDPRLFYADSTGVFWVSNMLWGTYRLEIMSPPTNTVLNFYVSSTNGTSQNAGSYTITRTNVVYAPDSVAYSANSVDGKLNNLSNALQASIDEIVISGGGVTATTATNIANVAATNAANTVVFTSSGDPVPTTNVTTAAGLIAAVKGATAGTTVGMLPGTYDLGTNVLVLADSVNLVGSGELATELIGYSDCGGIEAHLSATAGPQISPGNNSIVSGFTITCDTNAILTQAALGRHSGTWSGIGVSFLNPPANRPFTNVVMRHLFIRRGWFDCFHINSTNYCSVRIEDCRTDSDGSPFIFETGDPLKIVQADATFSRCVFVSKLRWWPTAIDTALGGIAWGPNFGSMDIQAGKGIQLLDCQMWAEDTTGSFPAQGWKGLNGLVNGGLYVNVGTADLNGFMTNQNLAGFCNYNGTNYWRSPTNSTAIFAAGVSTNQWDATALAALAAKGTNIYLKAGANVTVTTNGNLFTIASSAGEGSGITALDATNAAMGVVAWTNPVTQTQFAAALTNQETRGLQLSNSVTLYANGGAQAIKLDNVDSIISAGSFTGTSPGAFNGDGSALTGIATNGIDSTFYAWINSKGTGTGSGLTNGSDASFSSVTVTNTGTNWFGASYFTNGIYGNGTGLTNLNLSSMATNSASSNKFLRATSASTAEWGDVPAGTGSGAPWATVVKAGSNVTVTTNSASGTNEYTIAASAGTGTFDGALTNFAVIRRSFLDSPLAGVACNVAPVTNYAGSIVNGAFGVDIAKGCITNQVAGYYRIFAGFGWWNTANSISCTILTNGVSSGLGVGGYNQAKVYPATGGGILYLSENTFVQLQQEVSGVSSTYATNYFLELHRLK